MSLPVDGLLAIDKPAGPTSHDIVSIVRRSLHASRAGHLGTLDPPATGLLVLLLGRATRLARFVPAEPKLYEGTFVLGTTTTTDDTSGEIVRAHAGPLPQAEHVLAAAAGLIGAQRQVAPRVSARSVGGQRLYRLARRGAEFAPPSADVTIDRFDVEATADPATWGYRMRVSTGTYVRAAVRDLGARLGCGAAVASLRRTAIGTFRVQTAVPWTGDRVTFAESARVCLVPTDAVPLSPAPLTLDDARACRLFASGVALSCSSPDVEDGERAVRGPDGALLGIGRVIGGRIHPAVVLTADATGPRDRLPAGWTPPQGV